MKSSISGSITNDRQWEPMILTKSKTSKSSNSKSNDSKLTSQKIITPEEQIERSKPVSQIIVKGIIAARGIKKLKQTDLAKQANLDIKIIKEIETGKRIFCEQEIRKIERVLGKLQRK